MLARVVGRLPELRKYPSGLSQGLLTTFGFDGLSTTAPDRYEVYDLSTHASRTISFNPPAKLSPFPDLQGPGTDGSHWAFVLGGSYRSFNAGYFNLTTGAIVDPVPATTRTEYEDLDSPRLTRRLCAPVTNFVNASGDGVSTVIGFERPWAVLEQDSNALEAPLHADGRHGQSRRARPPGAEALSDRRPDEVRVDRGCLAVGRSALDRPPSGL